MTKTNKQCLSDGELHELSDGVSDNVPRLQAHVDICQICKNRFEEQKLNLSTFAKDPRVKSAKPIPDQIGRYKVIRLLGKGGQSKIYSVRHPKLEQTLVAKVYQSNAKNKEALENEADAIVRLRDAPNIPRVHDLGEDENGLFMVMEHVAGVELQKKLNEYSDFELAIKLVANIGRGLQPAHSQGIIHCDIKPENIIIDDNGDPQIIDFGVARIRDVWSDENYTAAQGGTLAYLAPELAKGKEASLTPATDVFALGVLLQQLLVGETVYSADTRDEFIAQAARGAARSSDKLDRYPSRLRRIVDKSIAEKQDERFRDGANLAEELEKLLEPKSKALFVSVVATLAVITAMVAMWFAGFFQSKLDHTVVGIIGKPPYVEPGNLHNSLPMEIGDDIRVSFKVPANLIWLVVWIDSQKNVSTYTRADSDLPWDKKPLDDKNDRLNWPVDPATRVALQAPLEGNSGTEMVLVLGQRGKFTLEQIAGIESKTAKILKDGSWPALPNSLVVRCSKNDVLEKYKEGTDRGVGKAEKSPVTILLNTVDQIRMEASKDCDFIMGEAFFKDGY